MDFNGLPMGLSMGLAMNEGALERFGRMTEAEKEDIILRCKDAKSKAEMEKIVDSIASGQNDGSSFLEELPKGPGIG
ncbi:MAG: hypothetical protein J6B10_04715 [Lachnospiraceae bacterium]|nr:hypothetical protein [Lachnospiraceae bacterium]